jgi:hypothetical protein
LLVIMLSAISIAFFAVGMVVYVLGDVSYKVFGIAIDLGIIAVLMSPRFETLVRSGSIGGLYATGLVATSILALGPVGRVLGHRFWYKAPFAWLMELPGFESARVPALFSSIQILCLAVLAALAVIRIWPVVTRWSVIATAGIAIAIVIDGWAIVPVAIVPPPLPVPVNADLVVELPTRGVFEDVAAMYRGMTHGLPVVNGYSGWMPPHYAQLQRDLRSNCVKSLESVRGGRSMDAVVWRYEPGAAQIDAGLRQMWPGSSREEMADVIVYRQPRLAPVDPGHLDHCK